MTTIQDIRRLSRRLSRSPAAEILLSCRRRKNRG